MLLLQPFYRCRWWWFTRTRTAFLSLGLCLTLLGQFVQIVPEHRIMTTLPFLDLCDEALFRLGSVPGRSGADFGVSITPRGLFFLLIIHYLHWIGGVLLLALSRLFGRAVRLLKLFSLPNAHPNVSLEAVVVEEH